MQRTDILPEFTVYQSSFGHWRVNSGLLTAPDGGVVLIDPGMSPDEIAYLKEQVGARPVHVLFNTHCHIDHVMGLSAWPHVLRLGSVHYTRFQERYLAYPGRVVEMARRYHLEWDPPVDYLPPTRTVDSRAPLHEVLPGWDVIPAPGHAHDLLMLFNSETHTLWASDVVTDAHEVPTMWDGAPCEYFDSLAMIEALEPEIIIPGHGEIALNRQQSIAYLRANRDYLEVLYDAVSECVQKGWSQDETIEACMHVQHPQHWIKPHSMNIRRMYKAALEKTPH